MARKGAIVVGNELDAWMDLHRFYRYHGYLTKDLAAYLKVSPRTIQRWLKGKTQPKERHLVLIKKFLSEKSKSDASD